MKRSPMPRRKAPIKRGTKPMRAPLYISAFFVVGCSVAFVLCLMSGWWLVASVNLAAVYLNTKTVFYEWERRR